jgi:hypothetical protein
MLSPSFRCLGGLPRTLQTHVSRPLSRLRSTRDLVRGASPDCDNRKRPTDGKRREVDFPTHFLVVRAYGADLA